MPAAQIPHRTIDVAITKAQRSEVAACLALEAGTTELREAAQEPVLALQHPLHPAEVGRHPGRAELLLASFEFLLKIRDLWPRSAYDLHRRTFVALDVLGQSGDAQSAAPDHLSRIDILCTCEDAKHCGLASAVTSDEPDPRPRVHLQPKIPQHGPASVRFLYGTKADECHTDLPTLTRYVLLTGRMMTPVRNRRITHLEDLRDLSILYQTFDVQGSRTCVALDRNPTAHGVATFA